MDKDYETTINGAICGNSDALIKLIKSEQNNIYSTLYYLNKSETEVNDLAQIVLIKLTKKIHQLKKPKYFKTWLNKIIINTYYDYLRKKKNLPYLTLSNEDKYFDKADSSKNPLVEILSSELDKIIKHSIEQLPTQYKIPLTLREIQGLSYCDISNITNTSIGTVKSRISRARTLVQNDISKYTRG